MVEKSQELQLSFLLSSLFIQAEVLMSFVQILVIYLWLCSLSIVSFLFFVYQLLSKVRTT